MNPHEMVAEIAVRYIDRGFEACACGHARLFHDAGPCTRCPCAQMRKTVEPDDTTGPNSG